jgi:hypothetical protein
MNLPGVAGRGMARPGQAGLGNIIRGVKSPDSFMFTVNTNKKTHNTNENTES